MRVCVCACCVCCVCVCVWGGKERDFGLFVGLMLTSTQSMLCRFFPVFFSMPSAWFTANLGGMKSLFDNVEQLTTKLRTALEHAHEVCLSLFGLVTIWAEEGQGRRKKGKAARLSIA